MKSKRLIPILGIAFCILAIGITAAIFLFNGKTEMTEITLDRTVLTLNKGQTAELRASFMPENASSSDVSWRSDNEAVVTVDQNGNISANGYGSATITASSKKAPNVKAICTVEVSNFYFVSSEGNDLSGDGTETNPFKTVYKARDAIRSLSELPDGGITVLIRSGEYVLEETLLLTPEDSGEEGKPIIYASYPGEEVYIVSKEYITGWKKLSAEEKGTDIFGMSDEAKENIYVAEIPSGWRFHFLYSNGVSLQNSRMIESDEWALDWPKAKATKKDYSPSGLKARFDNGVLSGIEGWQDIEIKLLTAIWWNVNAELTDIDPEKNTAYIQSKITVFYQDFQDWGGSYNIMNTPKYLDVAGEWCVDSVNGRVYYWPEDGKDPNSADIFAPKLCELVRFQGDEEEDNWQNQVEHITFRGINFFYSDRTPETQLDPEWLTRNGENPDGMIFMEGVSNCSVENCALGYSGGQSIVLNHYAQNCRITGNEIAQSSSGGIYITGYGPGTTDLNMNHYIAKNHIHNVGLDYMHSCAVQIYGSNHNLIEFNYFHDLPYAAVSIIGMAWNQMQQGPSYVDTINTYGENATMYNPRWDEIDSDSIKSYEDALPYQHSDNNVTQYNIIDDYMQTLRDGGSLYCWCSGRDKVWQYNVGSREFTDDWAVRAIHMDDCDGFNYIYKNLFYANGATDNSHTGGAPGARGDGGKTDLDIWDDTVSDNTWKENIITRTTYPDGYLTLRAYINQTVGSWLSKLPGAIVISPDNIFSEALIHLDANDIEGSAGTSVNTWKSKVGGCSAEQAESEAMPKLVSYGKYNAVSFDGNDYLTADVILEVRDLSGFTVIVVSKENDAAEAAGTNNIVTIGSGKNSITAGSGQTYVYADFGTGTGNLNDSNILQNDRSGSETGFTSTIFVKNGSDQVIYADGKPFASNSGYETISVSNGEMQICAKDNGFKGEISELLIFGRALTSAELETIENYLKNKYFALDEPLISYELHDDEEYSVVTLECTTPGASIYYTVDRSEPDSTSEKYEGPFKVDGTAVVRAIALKDGWLDSRVVGKVIAVSAKVPQENLLLHIDAADVAAEAGTRVEEIRSKVNDYIAKQGLAERQPVLEDRGGYYVLKFDGDDMLVVNDFANLNGHTGFTLVAVSRAEVTDAGGDGWCNRQSLIMIDESDGYGAIFVGSYQEDVRARIGIGTGNNFESYIIRADRPERKKGLTYAIVVKDGKQQSIYADGELLISSENGRDKIYNTNNTDLRIGTGISGFNGDIAELLIYDAALTEDQIASVSKYIETKYFDNEQ